MGRGCALCGGKAESRALAHMPPMPPTGRLLSAGDPPLPLRPLRFQYCPECGFIQLAPQAEAAPDYRNVSRATKRQLPSYVDDLLRRSRAYCRREAPRVMDIGCNDGAFLDRAAEHGYAFRLGVEPSRLLAEVCLRAGHETECTLFSHEAAVELARRHPPADVLFVRHVLEHVPDPADFLRGLRVMLAPGGVALIEVPDATNVVVDMLGHELWDEHLGYYTERTLRLMLARCGFDVLELSTEPHRGGRNLLCWVRAAENESRIDYAAGKERDLAACRCFGPAWAEFRARLRGRAAAWPKPVVAMGASHPQLNFVWYAGIEDSIHKMVDDDEEKVGKFLQLAEPAGIVSTSGLLAGDAPGTLLLTAFGCDSWTERVVRAMEDKGILVVDPYALMRR